MHTFASDEDKDMLTLCLLDCFEETSNIQEESRERKPPKFEERETAKACEKQSNVYPPPPSPNNNQCYKSVMFT